MTIYRTINQPTLICATEIPQYYKEAKRKSENSGKEDTQIKETE